MQGHHLKTALILTHQYLTYPKKKITKIESAHLVSKLEQPVNILQFWYF